MILETNFDNKAKKKIIVMDKVSVFLSSLIQAYCIGLKLENKKVEFQSDLL